MSEDQNILRIERRRRRKRKIEIIDNVVVLRKKLEHYFDLPINVATWAKKNLDVIDWLVFDSPIASRLRNPYSVRTLIILLYARSHDIPIARISKLVNMAPEQLYRMERILDRCKIKDLVYNILRLRR